MSKMVTKATAFEIANHWAMAASFFILSISGFAFLFHLSGVVAFFGGPMTMKAIHNYAGLIFAASLAFTVGSYLSESLQFTEDDMKWLMKGGGYLSKKSVVPAQDKLNAGQKLVYLLVLAAGISIAASGLLLWLSPETKGTTTISHLIHNMAFDLYMLIVPMHIYLASIASPGSLRIMISGTVPIEWARKRHGRWVEKIS